MKKIALLIVGCLCGSLVSCEFQNIDWQPGTDTVAPNTVRNVSVENLPGGAQITYDLPDDKEGMMEVLREAMENHDMLKDERFRAL